MSEILNSGAHVKTIILNFNYTDTFQQYLNHNLDFEVINIHGSLKNDSEPIIFGIGDETHPAYQILKEANRNEFFKNVKSFKYLESSNYSRLREIIETGEYDVDIIGHSCGISDRTLLKQVFDNKNCKKVQIYHHLGKESYKINTFGISLYFESNEQMMRKVEPFISARSVPQYPLDEENK